MKEQDLSKYQLSSSLLSTRTCVSMHELAVITGISRTKLRKVIAQSGVTMVKKNPLFKRSPYMVNVIEFTEKCFGKDVVDKYSSESETVKDLFIRVATLEYQFKSMVTLVESLKEKISNG